MSNDGRDLRSSSAIIAEKPIDAGVAVAAGTFPARAVGTPLRKPIEPVLREGLRRLIEFGKLNRRKDGGYGTHLREIIPNVIATQLKTRGFAVAGFHREIVPTQKGRRVHQEEPTSTECKS